MHLDSLLDHKLPSSRITERLDCGVNLHRDYNVFLKKTHIATTVANYWRFSLHFGELI